MNDRFKFNCPFNCEYRDYDVLPNDIIFHYCSLSSGIEEELKETRADSGEYKRTKFCRKIKFLEEHEE